MKFSIRLAAIAHNVGLIVIFGGLIGGTICSMLRTGRDLSGFFFGAAGIAFVVVFLGGFHIAVCDALQRMEERGKTSRETDRSA